MSTEEPVLLPQLKIVMRGILTRGIIAVYHDARRTSTARQTNPAPYCADYAGHKLHVDQNEKLVMYGVTHAAAVDGFSGMIVGFITMPIKNNVEIYSNLYK